VSILHTPLQLQLPLKIWMKSVAAPTIHSWIIHQIFIILVLCYTTCKDTTTWLMKHYRMPCASSCRWGKESFI